MSTVVKFANRVKEVSSMMVLLESSILEVHEDAVERSRQLLASPAPNHTASLTADAPADDQAHCAPYREWFVAHFSYPYPSPADKDHLLALVPRHTKTQLDTWFVNNRRRSGWAALRRAHTSGSAEAMRRLVADVDAGLAAPQVADKVARCRAFFDEAGRDRVSDEIQAIVRGEVPPLALAPPPPPPSSIVLAPLHPPNPPSSSRRRIEQRASRGIGHSAARAHRSASPPFPPPSSLPRVRPTYAASPSEMSPLDGGIAQLDLAGAPPRYPSAFGSFSSSTSSGGRAVSDSSSASIDSLLSYGTALDSGEGEVEVHVGDEAQAVPGSPPATSSLLAFAAGLGSSPVRHYPARPAVDSRPGSVAAAAHPYFCTVDELPTSSSLVGFAGARR
ncbi:hypothetical protein JCM8208_004395 [Rhodotorula glutinis]